MNHTHTQTTRGLFPNGATVRTQSRENFLPFLCVVSGLEILFASIHFRNKVKKMKILGVNCFTTEIGTVHLSSFFSAQRRLTRRRRGTHTKVNLMNYNTRNAPSYDDGSGEKHSPWWSVKLNSSWQSRKREGGGEQRWHTHKNTNATTVALSTLKYPTRLREKFMKNIGTRPVCVCVKGLGVC